MTDIEMERRLARGLLARPDFIARFGEASPWVAGHLAAAGIACARLQQMAAQAIAEDCRRVLPPVPPAESAELVQWLNAAAVAIVRQEDPDSLDSLRADAETILTDVRREMEAGA